MACIMEIFSLPPDLVLEKATRKKVFFGEFFSLCKILFLTVMVRAGSRLSKSSKMKAQETLPEIQRRIWKFNRK